MSAFHLVLVSFIASKVTYRLQDIKSMKLVVISSLCMDKAGK